MRFRRLCEVAALAAVLAVGLSGCIHADIGITFTSGSAGTFTVTEGISKQVANLLGSGGTSGVDQLKQQLDQAGKQQVQHYGGTYKVFDDGSYINEEWTHSFTSITQLNQLINDGSNSVSSTAGGTSSTPSNDSKIVVTQEGSDAHVTGLLDFTIPPSQGGSQVAALLQDARLQLTLTFPKLKAHNSDGVVNGNTITYTAHVNEKKTIDATGGDPGIGAVLLPIALGVVVLAALGAVVFFILRRRTPPPAAATAMPSSTPYPGNYGPSAGDYPPPQGVPPDAPPAH